MVWHATGTTVEELERSHLCGAEVDGRAVVLVWHAGRAVALDGACPHAGGNLAEGSLVDGRLTCPVHGAGFAVPSGAVLNGPDETDAADAGLAPLGQYPTRVVGGTIEVDLAEPSAR